MDFASHMTGGIILGIGTVYLARKVNIEPNTVLLIGSSILGSLLPDIDHPKSFIGNKIPILPSILYSTVGHRTITHSLVFALVVGILAAMFNIWIGIGLAVGILSHIILDMLTPMGVAYLYPFNKKKIKLKRG